MPRVVGEVRIHLRDEQWPAPARGLAEPGRLHVEAAGVDLRPEHAGSDGATHGVLAERILHRRDAIAQREHMPNLGAPEHEGSRTAVGR